MMPQHKSCKKRIRSDKKKRERNHYIKQTIKTYSKKIKQSDDKEEIDKLLPKYFSLVDKAAKKGVIHKNNANRKKARMAKFVNKIEK